MSIKKNEGLQAKTIHLDKEVIKSMMILGANEGITAKEYIENMVNKKAKTLKQTKEIA